ncbi:MAG: magnesium/cobalt transporter CorA [Clostridia bacterium]
MIRILALKKNGMLVDDMKIEQLNSDDIHWFWVDFNNPSQEEIKLLDSYFKFHHLAIEDCLYYLQRPKIDYYGSYDFFVMHSLNHETLLVQEVDLFIGENFVVSYHSEDLPEINQAWDEVKVNSKTWTQGHIYITYLIMDKIVDQYFPAVYRIEDELSDLDSLARKTMSRNLVEQLFDIRSDLLKLRRTINSMRDLLYRILNSTHLKEFEDSYLYFADIYDHLLKLSDMIESNRDMTADIRDSYLSINSNRMNIIMTVLTVITAIFIPLTFIAGVYGMNFSYMPELRWKYGYFLVLGFMGGIGVALFYWFKRKGWLDFYK